MVAEGASVYLLHFHSTLKLRYLIGYSLFSDSDKGYTDIHHLNFNWPLTGFIITISGCFKYLHSHT